MTKNVTELFQRYRQCLRDIWNTHFWGHSELRNWDSVSIFERLKPSIFQAIVLETLSDNCSCAQSVTNGMFQVVPSVPGPGGGSATHVVITKRDPLGGRSYVEELPALRSSEATLRFVDVFDWSVMGYLDLRYYVTRITKFASRPDLEGLEPLIDVCQAEVFWSPTDNSGLDEK